MMRSLRIGNNKHNYTHPRHPRYAEHDRIKLHQPFRGTLKVITYNIKLSRRTPKAVALLKDHDDLAGADIICLQEMDPNGVKLVADTLRYNYVYYPAILHPRSGKDFGNAVLAKWPIVADHKIILPKIGTSRLQRIAVCATIQAGKGLVSIISVHIHVFAKRLRRRIPIECMVESLDPSVKRYIIAGDFNTFSRHGCRVVFEAFKELGFRHVTESVGSTYSYWYFLNKKAALDHIFIKGMTIVNAGKVIDRTASDHMPVWGELKI